MQPDPDREAYIQTDYLRWNSSAFYFFSHSPTAPNWLWPKWAFNSLPVSLLLSRVAAYSLANLSSPKSQEESTRATLWRFSEVHWIRSISYISVGGTTSFTISNSTTRIFATFNTHALNQRHFSFFKSVITGLSFNQ
jgi:hypothetical protein